MLQDVNGITLFYEKEGAGEPLLLLHGNGEDHTIFDPLAKQLAKNYSVYSIDSRNHGQSQKTNDFSYETMANDIGNFIAELGLAPVRIVGFSDGAIIALLLAMQHPTYIKEMALLGINLSPSDFTEESLTFLQNLYKDTKDPLVKLMLEEPNISLAQAASVSTPTFLLAGEDDIFKPETFTKLAQAMPNATLQVFAGQTHDSYVNQTDFLYPYLCNFFSQ